MISRSIGIALATILITGIAPLPAGDSLAAQQVRPAKQKPPPKVAPTRGYRMYRTWVVTGLFQEADQTERTEATINEPVTMKFRWGTNAPGAEEGFWRLRGRPPQTGDRGGDDGAGIGLQAAPAGDMAVRPVDPGVRAAKPPEDQVLASGVATAAPGGEFEIDLRPYLPPPPSTPLVYYLEVVPRTKMKTDASVAVSPGQAGAKVPAQEVGIWSGPVVITYVVNTTPPTQFAIGDVYRKATLVLDHFILAEDQIGSGDEEYHLAGFVQELGRECADAGQLDCAFSVPLSQASFKYSRPVDPGGQLPKWIPIHDYFTASPYGGTLPNRWDFGLVMGGQVMGPRLFLLALSILEEDAGGSVDDWTLGLDELGDEVRKGDILEMAESEIEEYLTEHAAEAIRYVADGVQMVATAAGEAAGPIGAAVAVIAAITVSVVEDMQDDYYGTRGAKLRLDSNRVEDVHKLPGTLVGTGAARKYVLSPQRLEFKGPPASNQAGAWDGIVEIEFHWEFSEREQE